MIFTLENEPWVGSVEKIVKLIDVLPHDDMTNEVVQRQHTSEIVAPSTPRTRPHVIIQITTPLVTTHVNPSSTPRQ